MVVVDEGGVNAESRYWCFAVIVIAVQVLAIVVVVGGG